jgi:co-chaperonin GroES (HSP10)
VLSLGEQVEGLKKEDKIFFDRHAGHKIEINKQTYHVIKAQDVVVVL